MDYYMFDDPREKALRDAVHSSIRRLGGWTAGGRNVQLVELTGVPADELVIGDLITEELAITPAVSSDEPASAASARDRHPIEGRVSSRLESEQMAAWLAGGIRIPHRSRTIVLTRPSSSSMHRTSRSVSSSR
jgi:hypothetical protein